MALTPTERQAFLAEPHIAALAVAAGDERAPLTVPIWYSYTPGGQPWVLTGRTSRKAELIRAAGRFTLMVERTVPTVRYVTVEGPVDRIADATPEQTREMAARYLTGASLERYLAFASENNEPEIAVHLRPEHWLSADMGSL